MAPKRRRFGEMAERRAQKADALHGARAAAAAPPAAACCNLASSLLELWAWGSLTAVSMQKLALASTADGSPSAAAAALARIGGGGKQPSHCQRDMLRLLRKHLPPQPQTVAVKVPVTGGKDDEAARLVTQPYLPLHRAFAHSFLHYPAQFAKTWGTRAGAAAFWGGLLDDDPNAAEWRSALASKDLTAAFPYAVHGDGVPVFRHKSLECWSAASLLAEGSAKDVKTLTFCYWSHLRAVADRDGMDTEDAVWKVAKWDMEAFFEGAHPSRDWEQKPWNAGSAEAALAGAPLAGGLCGVPWVVKGDLEHFQNILKLESTAAHAPCLYCRADRELRPWTDFSAQATWKSTCWQSDAEWRAAHPVRHPLFGILRLGQHSVHADVLHTLALGVAQNAVANALWLLVYRLMKGSAKQNLQSVWAHLHDYYKENHTPTQIRKLTGSMFMPDAKAPRSNFPRMHTKAKETEYLVGAVLWTWRQFCAETDRDESVGAVLANLDRIFFLSRRVGSSLHLGAGEAAEIRAAMDRLLLHYTALGNDAAAKGDMLWNVTPKFHIAWHWAWQAQFLHPHASACYADESFVGVIAKIAKASTNGIRLALAGDAVFAKYQRGMAVHWALSPGSPFSPWR